MFRASDLPTCPECDVEMLENKTDGIHVCTQCGICEHMLVPEGFDYADVDWTGSTVVHKSQHVPLKYALDIMRKFGIDEALVPVIESRIKAVIFWADRTKPDGRKSLPSYVSTKF